MTFIDAVNRILRITGFIRGDTDILAAFTDTNHNSTSQMIQIAVQDEIIALFVENDLEYERTNSTITLVTGTRVYTLATDFTTMYGDPAFFLDRTQNYQIFEYPGGEQRLRLDILDYQTGQSGAPNYFYFTSGTANQVGFFPKPDASVNGRALYYDYEKSVIPSNSSDTLPFASNEEAYAFCSAAAARFQVMYERKKGEGLPDVTKDPAWRAAMSTLMIVMRGKAASGNYGKRYV